jgi:hypothetical protein
MIKKMIPKQTFSKFKYFDGMEIFSYNILLNLPMYIEFMITQ